jgi:hypothetical protein
VVGVELADRAVAVASANAVLNGLDDRVEFRTSDVLSALDVDETFDFLVANLPYAPVIPGTSAPDSIATIGNAVLWPLLEQLPPRLSERAGGIIATWRSAGDHGDTYQLRAVTEQLTSFGASVTAYVDPAFDTVDGVLRMLRRDLDQRSTEPDVTTAVEATRRLIERAELPMDGFYNQIVHFSRERGAPHTETFCLARPSTS